MKPLAIRLRLTVWYTAIMALMVGLFGFVAFFAMRRSIHTSVDEQLRDQADVVAELIERTGREGAEDLRHELREHAEIAPEDMLLQVSDQQGNWFYRSKSISAYQLPEPRAVVHRSVSVESRGMPLRVFTTIVQVEDQTYYVQVANLMDDFYEALDRFREILLVLAPLLLLLASAGGYWMSRRALAPVDAITRTAQDIGGQNLSRRLAVPQTGDELQRLTETLNGMLDRLERAFKRITQFTGDASHELRTPLSVMRTRAEIILRRPRSEAEYREALDQILKELETTTDLIEKLMLLARADSGAEALQFAPVNLTDTLREVCRQGRALAQAKQINFQEQISEGPVTVAGDAHALQRLFLILIDNAVKYTPTEGHITASLTKTSNFAVAEIRDTGIGIGEADLPHIFERFYRADKARSREMGGAGLGLSIGRWIAEAHSGTIEVESAVGQGSEFRVRLPVSNS